MLYDSVSNEIAADIPHSSPMARMLHNSAANNLVRNTAK